MKIPPFYTQNPPSHPSLLIISKVIPLYLVLICALSGSLHLTLLCFMSLRMVQSKYILVSYRDCELSVLYCIVSYVNSLTPRLLLIRGTVLAMSSKHSLWIGLSGLSLSFLSEKSIVKKCWVKLHLFINIIHNIKLQLTANYPVLMQVTWLLCHFDWAILYSES